MQWENLPKRLDDVASCKGEKSVQVTKLKNCVYNFDCDEDVKRIRSLYNYLKHRGTIHVEGLGANFDKLAWDISGLPVPMLSRQSYTVQQLENYILPYHLKFIRYFNSIIEIIIPSEYLSNTIPLLDYLRTGLKIARANQNLNQ